MQEFEEKIRAYELLKGMKNEKLGGQDSKIKDGDDAKPKPDPGIRNNPEPKKRDTDKMKKIVSGIGAITGLKNLGDDNHAMFENVGEGTQNDEIAKLLISQTPIEKPATNMDFTPLVGEVKLQIQKLFLKDKKFDLKKYKSYFLLFRLPGITKNYLEKEVYANLLANFKFALRVTVLNVLEESISDEIQVNFMGDLDGRREELCSTSLRWKSCLTAPNEWAVNNKFTFKSKSEGTEMLDSRIQIKWIDTTSDESKTTDIDDYYLKPQFRPS